MTAVAEFYMYWLALTPWPYWGEELATEEGYYKSVGTINIKGNQVEINLSIDNYDDKKLDPDSWNGKYILVWRAK